MKTCLETWEKLKIAYFEKRDAGIVADYLSDDVMWTDTFRDIHVCGKSELMCALGKTAGFRAPLGIQFEEPVIHMRGDFCANITVQGSFTEPDSEDGTTVAYVSACFLKDKRGWLADNLVLSGSHKLDRAQLYHRIADDTRVGIAISDAETHNIYYVNKALMEMLHLPDDNYTGKKCYEFLRGGSFPCATCAARRLSVNEMCSAIHHFSEYDTYLKVQSTLIEWEGRHVLVEYDTDITEMHKEQMLTARKYELEKVKSQMVDSGLIARAIFNLARHTVIELDGCEKGYLSAAASASFEDVVAKSSRLIADSGERSDYLALNDRDWLLKEFVEGISEHSFEYRRKLPDGRVIWVRNILRLLQEPSTGELRLFEYCYDIQKQKMMDVLLDNVVKADNESIAAIDIHRGLATLFSGRRYIESSDTSPLSLKETVRRYAEKEVASEDRERYIEIFSAENVETNMRDRDIYEETIHALRKDGTMGVMKVRFFNYDPSNGVYFSLRTDITDIISAEERKNRVLKEALEVARQANRAKTDFLASMSHDMRTPMNAIIGMADIALSEHGDEKQVNESLTVIKESADQLLHLINNILDMSRLKSGIVTGEKTVFSHKTEISRAEERFMPLMKARGLVLCLTTSINHDVCAGNVEHLHRIIDNIISNAIKYSHNGGKIMFDVTELPGMKDGVAYFRVTVTDNGIGMTSEEMKHIFEPFYRGDRAVTYGTEGSGLGLSIAKSMADLQGITIDVTSAPDRGSAFTLTIPLSVTEGEVKQQPDGTGQSTELAKLSGVSVLLVEDHPINAMVVEKILERAKIKVTVAENGKIGSDVFCSSKPGTFDAILMDIRMPVMDGYAATAAIRRSSHPQAASIPIIAMTANAFAEDRQRCLNSGMNDHIAKPVNTALIYATIAKWTGRQ